MDYKVSIIVPIFGVEKFIERCARSLFEQTLEDIEFIFVDDCTKDKSIEILTGILSEYPNRRQHARILKHEHNKGLPQARKTGILEASGQFLAHCDSDDWPDKTMYEKMYNKAIEGNFDIVSADYYISDGLHDIPKVLSINKKRLMQGPVWNKLIKRSLYTNNEIQYPVVNKAEDGALMTQLSYFASSFIHISEPLYHYYINPESMTRIITEEECVKRMEQEKENTILRIAFLERMGAVDGYKPDIIEWKWFTRNNLLPVYKNRKFFKLWLSTYPEINKDLLLCRGISLRSKTIFLLQILHLYNMFRNARDIRNR